VFEEAEEDRKRVRPTGERDREARWRIIARLPKAAATSWCTKASRGTSASPLSAVLYAASSALDTDTFVTLSEVDEEGKIFQLTQGVVRARFRDSCKRPESLQPGTTYRYDIDLWHTGIEIPAGGKVRMEVASDSFPRFSRNLNTGGDSETETEWMVAERTVFHDAERASCVLLPVISRAIME
jgi:putative CocE/NonD family hydrolase